MPNVSLVCKQLTEPFLHPARRSHSETAHVMLTGRGANQFAESVGVAAVPTEALVTEFERAEWQKHKTYVTGVEENFNSRW